MKTNTKLMVVSTAAALTAAAGLIFFTPMLAWERWTELLLLLVLLVIFKFRGIGVSRYIRHSLSVSIYLTAIFVFGTGEAMWLAILANLIYGLMADIDLIKVFLNLLQRSLTVLLVGLVFSFLHPNIGELSVPHSLPAMLIGLVLYNFVNLVLVSVITVLLDSSAYAGIKHIFHPRIWFYYLMFGYVGVIFSFFIATWQMEGLLIFGALLLGISEIIRYSFYLVAEQQRRIQAEQELVLDSKTKVYNYRFLSEWLDQDSDYPVTMLFIDIDDFKLFNDTYGHEYGDEVLKTVAQTIRSSVRDEDYVVRFGGEEFVVILPHTNRARGLVIAKRIQAKLAELSELELERELTVSIGVASYPDDAQDRMELLRRADMAMYRAKTSGKNQCCTCS